MIEFSGGEISVLDKLITVRTPVIKVSEPSLAEAIVVTMSLTSYLFWGVIILIAAAIAITVLTGGAGAVVGTPVAGAAATGMVGAYPASQVMRLSWAFGGVGTVKYLYSNYEVTEKLPGSVVLRLLRLS